MAVEADPGVLTPAILAEIRALKPDLIAEVSRRRGMPAEVSHPDPPGVSRPDPAPDPPPFDRRSAVALDLDVIPYGSEPAGTFLGHRAVGLADVRASAEAGAAHNRSVLGAG